MTSDASDLRRPNDGYRVVSLPFSGGFMVGLSSRLLVAALAVGALFAPTAMAASMVTRFETYGALCERSGRTFLLPDNPIAVSDPQSNVEAVPALVPAKCIGKISVNGFSWSQLEPSDLLVTKRGGRVTIPARIAGTISGSTVRVRELQTTDLTSVRYDGFSLARPAILSSALVSRSWPSTCDLGDGRSLSQEVPLQARTLALVAIQEDPDLRIRTLVDGKMEVVTYRSLSAPVRNVANDIGATVCAETETQRLSASQVQAFLRTRNISATAVDATLPSGRAVVLVAGERITRTQKSQIMTTFGSRIVVDSAIRT